MWLILSGDWKVVKMGRFWPKSKAIHLVFWSHWILMKIQCDWFWVEIEKWWKWADFDQKVRLYTWYFDQFWSKFNVTDFEWRLKSGENGQFWPKSKAIHLVFNFHQNSMWLILSGDWKVVKMGRFWPKSKAIHLVFWPIFTKFNVTDFEWRLKSGENGQILTKK